MRKALGLVGVTLLFAGPALAADVDRPASPYKAPAYAPALSWTGWYIGANAGWIGSADNSISNTATETEGGGLGTALAIGGIPASIDTRLSGFIGGGQIGRNWQTDKFVFGLEGDFDGISAKSRTTTAFPGILTFLPFSSAFSREMDWLSTVRARAGVTVMPTFMLFATGGLAVGETTVGNAFICPQCPAVAGSTMSNSDTKISAGWTIGAGAEWMFAPNWSMKAEYLFVDLGTHSSTVTYNFNPGNGPQTSTLTSTAHDTSNIVRAGINYHF